MLFIKKFIFIWLCIFFTFSIHGIEVKVIDGSRKSFEVRTSKRIIKFESRYLSKKVHLEKCNRSHFKYLAQQLQEHKAQLVTVIDSRKFSDALRVVVNGKQNIAFRNTDSGNFFVSLDSEFLNLWITSKRLCKK